MGLGKTLFKVGLVAGAAYGGYFLYKRFGKQGAQSGKDFEDLADVNFDYNEDAASDVSFADRIKAAAERQLNKIQ